MKHTCALLVVAAALVGLGSPGNFAAAQDGAARPARPAAQNRPAKPTAPNVVEVPGRNEVNEWTISLAGGLLEGTFIRYAADIAKVLDDGNNLRVIPLVTYGAVGNVTDLLHLRGVDIAITQADVLEHFRRELQISNIQDRIHFISPLFHSEVHIYTREEFKTIKDLTGRKVAFNTRGSAANLTGGQEPERVVAAEVTPNIFATLGVPAFIGRQAAARGIPRRAVRRCHAAAAAVGHHRRLVDHAGGPSEVAGREPERRLAGGDAGLFREHGDDARSRTIHRRNG